MEHEIRKVKVDKKGRVSATTRETKPDNVKSVVSDECDGVAHPDLLATMKAIAPHLAILTGYIPVKEVKDIKQPVKGNMLDSFNVRGLSISGEDEDQRVIISGHRILDNGKAVILNTPLEALNAEGEKRYKFVEDLTDCIAAVKKETVLYLGGKYAADPQGDLFKGKDPNEGKE